MNDKKYFKGWAEVYDFTFRQATKGIAFKLVTTLISIAIIAAFIIANIVAAKPDDKSANETSPIAKVMILDESGLTPIDYQTVNPVLSEDRFKNIQYVTVEDKTVSELIQDAGSDSAQTIALNITKNESGYQLEAYIPSGSDIPKNKAQDLISQMSTGFETGKLLQAGLSPEMLALVLNPIVTSYSDVGESTSIVAILIKMLAPMLFGLMLYFMLLLYGQTISKSVSTEKTSRLIETLLTSVHPYALITGKILAVASMAILQFMIWVLSIFAGLYGGNAIARIFYPDYHNSVIMVINFLKDNIGETAMTLPAVILAIIFFCVGFLFYCVLAGLAGCMVSKPEDVASTQSIFQFPVIISWLVCYIASAAGNNAILSVARYIPFTAPFCVPVDLITGTIGLVQGIISLVLLMIFTLLTIILSSRIYKGLVLYTGEKVNLQLLRNVLKK